MVVYNSFFGGGWYKWADTSKQQIPTEASARSANAGCGDGVKSNTSSRGPSLNTTCNNHAPSSCNHAPSSCSHASSNCHSHRPNNNTYNMEPPTLQKYFHNWPYTPKKTFPAPLLDDLPVKLFSTSTEHHLHEKPSTMNNRHPHVTQQHAAVTRSAQRPSTFPVIHGAPHSLKDKVRCQQIQPSSLAQSRQFIKPATFQSNNYNSKTQSIPPGFIHEDALILARRGKRVESPCRKFNSLIARKPKVNTATHNPACKNIFTTNAKAVEILKLQNFLNNTRMSNTREHEHDRLKRTEPNTYYVSSDETDASDSITTVSKLPLARKMIHLPTFKHMQLSRQTDSKTSIDPAELSMTEPLPPSPSAPGTSDRKKQPPQMPKPSSPQVKSHFDHLDEDPLPWPKLSEGRQRYSMRTPSPPFRVPSKDVSLSTWYWNRAVKESPIDGKSTHEQQCMVNPARSPKRPTHINLPNGMPQNRLFQESREPTSSITDTLHVSSSPEEIFLTPPEYSLHVATHGTDDCTNVGLLKRPRVPFQSASLQGNKMTKPLHHWSSSRHVHSMRVQCIRRMRSIFVVSRKVGTKSKKKKKKQAATVRRHASPTKLKRSSTEQNIEMSQIAKKNKPNSAIVPWDPSINSKPSKTKNKPSSAIVPWNSKTSRTKNRLNSAIVPWDPNINSKPSKTKNKPSSAIEPWDRNIGSKPPKTKNTPNSDIVPWDPNINSKPSKAKSKPNSDIVPWDPNINSKPSKTKSKPNSDIVPWDPNINSKPPKTKNTPNSAIAPWDSSIKPRQSETKDTASSAVIPWDSTVQSKTKNKKRSKSTKKKSTQHAFIEEIHYEVASESKTLDEITTSFSTGPDLLQGPKDNIMGDDGNTIVPHLLSPNIIARQPCKPAIAYNDSSVALAQSTHQPQEVDQHTTGYNHALVSENDCLDQLTRLGPGIQDAPFPTTCQNDTDIGATRDMLKSANIKENSKGAAFTIIQIMSEERTVSMSEANSKTCSGNPNGDSEISDERSSVQTLVSTQTKHVVEMKTSSRGGSQCPDTDMTQLLQSLSSFGNVEHDSHLQPEETKNNKKRSTEKRRNKKRKKDKIIKSSVGKKSKALALQGTHNANKCMAIVPVNTVLDTSVDKFYTPASSPLNNGKMAKTKRKSVRNRAVISNSDHDVATSKVSTMKQFNIPSNAAMRSERKTRSRLSQVHSWSPSPPKHILQHDTTAGDEDAMRHNSNVVHNMTNKKPPPIPLRQNIRKEHSTLGQHSNELETSHTTGGQTSRPPSTPVFPKRKSIPPTPVSLTKENMPSSFEPIRLHKEAIATTLSNVSMETPSDISTESRASTPGRLSKEPRAITPRSISKEPRATTPRSISKEPRATTPRSISKEPRATTPRSISKEPRATTPRSISNEPRATTPKSLSNEPRATTPRIISNEPRETTPGSISKASRAATPRSLSNEPRVATPRSLLNEPRATTPRSLSNEPRSPTPRSISKESRATTPKSVSNEPRATAPRSISNEPRATTPRSLSNEPRATTPKSISNEPRATTPRSISNEPRAITPRSISNEPRAITPGSISKASRAITPRSLSNEPRATTPRSLSNEPRATTPRSKSKESRATTPRSISKDSRPVTPTRLHNVARTTTPTRLYTEENEATHIRLPSGAFAATPKCVPKESRAATTKEQLSSTVNESSSLSRGNGRQKEHESPHTTENAMMEQSSSHVKQNESRNVDRYKNTFSSIHFQKNSNEDATKDPSSLSPAPLHQIECQPPVTEKAQISTDQISTELQFPRSINTKQSHAILAPAKLIWQPQTDLYKEQKPKDIVSTKSSGHDHSSVDMSCQPRDSDRSITTELRLAGKCCDPNDENACPPTISRCASKHSPPVPTTYESHSINTTYGPLSEPGGMQTRRSSLPTEYILHKIHTKAERRARSVSPENINIVTMPEGYSKPLKIPADPIRNPAPTSSRWKVITYADLPQSETRVPLVKAGKNVLRTRSGSKSPVAKKPPSGKKLLKRNVKS